MPALHVWMNGQHVGIWTLGRRGVSEFVYDPAWIQSPYFRVLSLSIPATADLTVRGAQVTSYFDNLLPDSTAIRKNASVNVSEFAPKPSSCWPLSVEPA